MTYIYCAYEGCFGTAEDDEVLCPVHNSEVNMKDVIKTLINEKLNHKEEIADSLGDISRFFRDVMPSLTGQILEAITGSEKYRNTLLDLKEAELKLKQEELKLLNEPMPEITVQEPSDPKDDESELLLEAIDKWADHALDEDQYKQFEAVLHGQPILETK